MQFVVAATHRGADVRLGDGPAQLVCISRSEEIAAGGSSIQQYDDVEIGYDNNCDADILDAGDDIQIDDDFSSNVMSLSYDNNGNLTDDGVYKYEYDAWNRLVEAKRRVDAETGVATYAFLGDNRRASKVVQNCGAEETANDGGNTTVHYYYGLGGPSLQGWGTRMSGAWSIYETRNGSNQATAQYVWGTQYTDELVMVDINGDVTESNDCDPDDQSGESTADERYFYHQDRNWNVVALSEYDTIGTNNGRIVERYSYTPYGQFVVLTGDSGNGELGNLLPTSAVGSPFAHQGLPMDHEKTTYQNRHREYAPDLQRFLERDPLRYRDGGNVYVYLGGAPATANDPTGLACERPCGGPPPDGGLSNNPGTIWGTRSLCRCVDRCAATGEGEVTKPLQHGVKCLEADYQDAQALAEADAQSTPLTGECRSYIPGAPFFCETSGGLGDCVEAGTQFGQPQRDSFDRGGLFGGVLVCKVTITLYKECSCIVWM